MNFNFKKKYGQNFLQEKRFINNIVDSVDASSDDLIIEIGPGGGALTEQLVKKNCCLLAYEIDEDTKPLLSKLENDKVKIIYDDFLKRNIIEDIKDIKYNNLYIVGNLPYYITTPIIKKIIDDNINAKEIVVMVQDEVADRFSAKVDSKDYSSITVFLNYFYDIKKLFVVSKKNFYPVPGVDSAVVKLIKKDNLLDVDFKKFNRLVKDSFQFKRKNLRNNLKQYDLGLIESVLNKYNFSLSDRAENLNYEIFVDIANNL